ncbi:MAG: tetratricopeptide repeat protein [Planctomycetes bacterium]|nr:tetratricopeptide repeat protein [Planctomycetota bacterium]
MSVMFWALLITAAAFTAYANSFHGPFVFDDIHDIVNNPLVRAIWHSPSDILNAPDSSVSGRPFVTATLSLNYAFGGLNTTGYHAVNFAIHLASALLLMGLVRRTLLLPGFGWSDTHAVCTAGAAALIWVVHPLNTSSVTFVIRRTESLMAMFYLLTLYCFVRGCAGCWGWHVAAWVACLLGMATKEVMVSAPIAIILYDRIFIAGNWRAVLHRWRVHMGLIATWLLLAVLVIHAWAHKVGVGQGFGGLTTWDYLCIQGPAILHYLWLTVWPATLVFDYGEVHGGVDVPQHWPEYVPQGLAILGLVLLTAQLLRKHPRWGWPCALFFLVLAPTSSVMPLFTEAIVEHRFYLPLAVVVVLTVLIASCLVRHLNSRVAWAGAAVVLVTVGVPLAYRTHMRNVDYQSAIVIWRDTIEKRPGNARAWENLGLLMMQSGRDADAIPYFQTAVRLQPKMINAHRSLGVALMNIGRLGNAMAEFDCALELNPTHTEALNDKGTVLARLNRMSEAEVQFIKAVKTKPDYSLALYNLGATRMCLGNTRGAVESLRSAIRSNEDYVDALKLLAWVLSTDPDPTIRNGLVAAQLARRACDLTSNSDAWALDALAAATAETGQFDAAVKIIDHAIEAARKSSPNGLVNDALLHRAAFLDGRPWRE